MAVSISTIPSAGQGLRRARTHLPEPWGGAGRLAYQGFVVDLLANELVLAERVAGLARDGVNGPLLHLLLDGAEQGEEGLPGALLDTEKSRVGWTLGPGCAEPGLPQPLPLRRAAFHASVLILFSCSHPAPSHCHS